MLCNSQYLTGSWHSRGGYSRALRCRGVVVAGSNMEVDQKGFDVNCKHRFTTSFLEKGVTSAGFVESVEESNRSFLKGGGGGGGGRGD